MLEAQQLTARRGPVTLFSDVSFALRSGEALVVTGANGAGKTTLLRIVAGLTRPLAGTLSWDGSVLAPLCPMMRARTLYIGHAIALKDEMTAEENLGSMVRLLGSTADCSSLRAALTLWSLDAQRALPARVLSQGQRRRVGLARLRLVQRPLWILDEPTTALDAPGVTTLQDLIARHLAQGGAAIIATHHDMALPSRAKRALHLQ
jgi:heme exporter protein A